MARLPGAEGILERPAKGGQGEDAPGPAALHRRRRDRGGVLALSAFGSTFQNSLCAW